MSVSQDNQAFEAIFNEKQVSTWLGISLPSLQRMRSDGRGPAFVQLSERRIAYRKSAVEEWLVARTISRVGELNVRSIATNVPLVPEQGSTVAGKAGDAP
jgi:predicted DNA-binding transcriptional regulator AlpA